MMNQTLTAIEGLRVGHWEDGSGLTGCTVILCPAGTIGGVDQRGGAPGTRETDLLRPLQMMEQVHAVVLSGGSAYGLRTADGVMIYLREQGIGFPTGSGVPVPIVPAAILYDLEVGAAVFPSSTNGYEAAASASNATVRQGNIGVGIGCTVGKLAGMQRATKTGLGTAAIILPDGLIVAALFAVNAVGDVLADNGEIIAGLRDAATGQFVGTLNTMRHMIAPSPDTPTSNTVIGIVATNAKLTKSQTNKVAQMAHDGLARAVTPAHTMYDGDTIFSLATGQLPADLNLVGALAAEVTADAIRAGVTHASTLGGVRAGTKQ